MQSTDKYILAIFLGFVVYATLHENLRVYLSMMGLKS